MDENILRKFKIRINEILEKNNSKNSLLYVKKKQITNLSV